MAFIRYFKGFTEKYWGKRENSDTKKGAKKLPF
jgi:hypothetical protein